MSLFNIRRWDSKNFFLLFILESRFFFGHYAAHLEVVEQGPNGGNGETVGLPVVATQLLHISPGPAAAGLVTVHPGQLVLNVDEHVTLQVARQHLLSTVLTAQHRLLNSSSPKKKWDMANTANKSSYCVRCG